MQPPPKFSQKKMVRLDTLWNLLTYICICVYGGVKAIINLSPNPVHAPIINQFIPIPHYTLSG